MKLTVDKKTDSNLSSSKKKVWTNPELTFLDKNKTIKGTSSVLKGFTIKFAS